MRGMARGSSLLSVSIACLAGAGACAPQLILVSFLRFCAGCSQLLVHLVFLVLPHMQSSSRSCFVCNHLVGPASYAII